MNVQQRKTRVTADVFRNQDEDEIAQGRHFHLLPTSSIRDSIAFFLEGKLRALLIKKTKYNQDQLVLQYN